MRGEINQSPTDELIRFERAGFVIKRIGCDMLNCPIEYQTGWTFDVYKFIERQDEKGRIEIPHYCRNGMLYAGKKCELLDFLNNFLPLIN